VKNNLDKHVIAYEGQCRYDFDNEIMLNWYPKRIIQLTKNAKSILELGIGHGFTAEIFSKHFNRHVVLEGSLAVIENFKKNFLNCRAQLIETYFEDFITDEKFDIIVMGFILEHVDNPLEIMTRFKTFLAHDGKIFIAVPNAEVLNRRLGHLSGMLPDIQQLSENDIVLGHKRYYTVKSLTEEVRRAGYKIERMEGIYLKPFTTKQIMSLNFNKKILHALCKVGVDYPELCCGILAQLQAVR
jgi:2-polyprenyl-3-methyl-5-hydroxy-6-metoxy-1,4-benzoquinol methylase